MVIIVNTFVTHYFKQDVRLFHFTAMKTLVLNMIGMYSIVFLSLYSNKNSLLNDCFWLENNEDIIQKTCDPKLKRPI